MPGEHPLPDEALVVRGGTMRPGALLEVALDAASSVGVTAISVFVGESAAVGVDDLVDMGQVPHASIRVSTVGRIRAAGFVIRRSGRYPHCSVELGDRPSVETAVRLAAAFDPPVPNPRSGSQR